METKTYFAGSVPAALEVARKELGGEAVLIGSRPAPPEAKQFGRLEVTFAYNARSSAPPSSGLGSSPQSLWSSPELDDIRRQLQALRTAVGTIPAPEAETSYLADQLKAAGFESAFVQETLESIVKLPGDPAHLAATELTKKIPVAAFTDLKPGESRVLAFVGAPGRGKTTSLVKIAIARGLTQGIPVRLCSAGAHAVGAHEQLARYAAVLGTPHLSFESFESLGLALNAESWKGLTLIDTAGISSADQTELRECEGFLSRRQEIEKHLVLRADSRSADMLNVISRFAALRPSRLLFTGLDETLSLAPMVETLVRSAIPGAFVCSGQQIPEDLQPINAAELVHDVFARVVLPVAKTRFAAAA